MGDNKTQLSEVVDLLLFYVRFRYLSSIEGFTYLFLMSIADRGACGHIDYSRMAEIFGRSKCRCRSYVYRLKRYGLIEGAMADGNGGAYFRLAIPTFSSSTDTGPPDQPDKDQAKARNGEQHSHEVLPAGSEPAPGQL